MNKLEFEIPVHQMSKSQRKIADFIMKSAERIPFYTEEDIAVKAGVSIATVSRFWRIIGYDNLKSFKKYLQETQHSTPARKMQHVLEQTDREVVGRMITSAAVNLEETAKRISRDAFDRAVEALNAADTIYVHGPGSTSCLSDLLRFRLNRIGMEVRIMAQSGHELLESLVHAGPKDVVLFFGFVRKSPEATVILEQASESGYTTILVTDLLLSDMIDDSHIVLQVDRGDADAFHSLVAPMTIVESLSVSLAGQRGEAAMDKLKQLHAMRKQYATLLPK
ncbi:MurR/RpiR family transcriptional regulator [Paenibacillus oenotherae]|uniref:MurR/RpiR family transcriptional regulator n=1 Tax=Paenibacillus oenotherae TaxID=1435645 RepID=A0ABS7D7F1_9BACL|nr:MurR/RpiR family transcriptional regulator [Paenibacillus oenotherae]MBW7475800.1 MurR/RpiR family transcriptional regulator [Paenibacillus oenotherae]